MDLNYLRFIVLSRARELIGNKDPSHDYYHSVRVLSNAEGIAAVEGGDLEIIIPGAGMHDSVTYPKDDSRSKGAVYESADAAEDLLREISGYNFLKIPSVRTCIIEHSYSGGVRPELLESKIVQDADRLEATGAISIMRTFSSAGQMRKPFYDDSDPFCESRAPEPFEYALDLFYDRLLRVGNLMNTETGKRMAEERTTFLYSFLEQLRRELRL